MSDTLSHPVPPLRKRRHRPTGRRLGALDILEKVFDTAVEALVRCRARRTAALQR